MSSDIEDLRKELDIVDVISDYLHLERAGTNFKANCPFHADKTPSFFVSPSKQIFKCFGCGVGGDAIKFVSLYENVSYRDAAIQLARKYGIRVRIGKEKKVDEDLLRALEEVAEFYHSKLRESDQALDYLKSRGIDTHTIKRFQIGYSPSSGELVKFLKDRGILEVYEKSGNIKDLGEGKYRDLFQRRVIFPIRDIRGRVVGFGGRVLEDDGPKYINSPESEVFKKRDLLFGLYESLSYLRDLKKAILVEGYFDVISLHQAGFRYALAPLGTSFGQEHAKVLSKIVSKVYLLFDSDSAGQRAMRSAVATLLREGLEVYPVSLPEGYDPHDFAVKEGREALRSLIEGSKEVFESLLEKISKGEEVDQTVRDITLYAGYLKDEIRAYSLLTKVSNLTRIPYEVLAGRVSSARQEAEEKEKISFTEKIFLKGLMELRPQINLEDLNLSPRAREIAELILQEEIFEVPEEVASFRVPDLEGIFRSALERLRFEIEKEEVGVSDVRSAVRARIRNHRGGLRNIHRWRFKVEK